MMIAGSLFARALLLVSAILSTVLAAHAQTPGAAPAYPTKPVRLITTYPPGGASDIMARIIEIGRAHV